MDEKVNRRPKGSTGKPHVNRKDYKFGKLSGKSLKEVQRKSSYKKCLNGLLGDGLYL